MTEEQSWRRFDADGARWEARMAATGPAANEEGQVVEFVCVDGTRKPRRLSVAGSIADMDEDALRRAYRQARPIGGDHYGRPGKPAADAS